MTSRGIRLLFGVNVVGLLAVSHSVVGRFRTFVLVVVDDELSPSPIEACLYTKKIPKLIVFLYEYDSDVSMPPRRRIW
jgi:hypothetical protein